MLNRTGMHVKWTCARCGVDGKLHYSENVSRTRAFNDVYRDHGIDPSMIGNEQIAAHCMDIHVEIRRQRPAATQKHLFE